MAFEFVTTAESSLTDCFQTEVPEAIRLALKLGKRDKIRYTIAQTGEVTITRASAESELQSDPALDLSTRSFQRLLRRAAPFPPALLERTKELTEGVEVDLNAHLPPDEYFLN
ncbi:antitoxin PrlF [Pararobbsia alpina]|uniref:type II toxin-antitoxin system PrlF family antitoxin n=1 Tax=Pararobbsia alpina TaxID=621374 RepID=UPI0039A7162A